MWLKTSSILYPNMYIFLVSHPATGKTRTIRRARNYLLQMHEPYVAPVSMTFSALIDNLVKCKRFMPRLPQPPLEYNSMAIVADELGAFIHKYDKEMVDGLSALYDPDPYGQRRRGGEINIKIPSPQVNILCGTTPSNLMELMPEGAWSQGFASRVIMAFSDERIVGDDFADITTGLSKDLLHDLEMINSISGEFTVTEDYRNLVNLWRAQGEEPSPKHPKLLHYNARRRVHLYKLSMIASLDQSNIPVLSRNEFNTAMNWLVQVEAFMADIFKAGAAGGDSAAMDEIYHFVLVADKGKGVPEPAIVRRARELVPAHSVMRVLEVMERSGMIKATSMNVRTGIRHYIAISPDLNPS